MGAFLQCKQSALHPNGDCREVFLLDGMTSVLVDDALIIVDKRFALVYDSALFSLLNGTAIF